MKIDIDGFAVLRSIAAHHRIFADVTPEAAKAARTLVLKQLKAKTADLKCLREIRKAVGTDSFELIADGMTDTEVKSIISKLDKNHPELKQSDAQWRRHHMRALADGSIEPAEKAKPAPKTQKRKKDASEPAGSIDLLVYNSAGARRKR